MQFCEYSKYNLFFLSARWLARSDHAEYETAAFIDPSARLLWVPHETWLQMEILGQALLRAQGRLSLLL